MRSPLIVALKCTWAPTATPTPHTRKGKPLPASGLRVTVSVIIPNAKRSQWSLLAVCLSTKLFGVKSPYYRLSFNTAPTPDVCGPTHPPCVNAEQHIDVSYVFVLTPSHYLGLSRDCCVL